MDKVDATMATVNEQRELANEVAEAISNPMYSGAELDEVSTGSPFPPLLDLDGNLTFNRINSEKNWQSWSRLSSTSS